MSALAIDINGKKMRLGDRVIKAEGQEYSGKVVSIFENLDGKQRVVVECEVPEVRGLLHIYRPDQMLVVENAQPDGGRE